ncbi:winged helix-turn-helix transcriptional regulator [Mucilaginibacter pedocola]|uniref:HxlR family transcriptional regulator n=1 Tax=Mucilaginibacter pedocola TaxID=1792845 RepID=A0A1S9P6J8_9SPHI|nr:helix-turn-helix domain-containing protein [Mucilaginibacter pedocola]OOQ56572.1 HxlR family transcriptional regulator [Mucilaginibacter pedocola]
MKKASDRKIPLNLQCGLDLVGEVLYGKWKIRLLWFINQGHRRPSQLNKKIPDASRRVLTIQLNELQQHDLITKTVYPELPPHVEYHLTPFGETLIPVISAIGQWGDEHEQKLRKLITAEE